MEKKLTQEEAIALALEKQKEEFLLILKQREKNSVEVAGNVTELIQIDGKPIIDKETKQQKEIGGELAFYPNKYTLKLTFDGGELETPITKEWFESLILGERYLAIGRLARVTEFGNILIKPVFSHFQKI
jgi:hypothetical protein